MNCDTFVLISSAISAAESNESFMTWRLLSRVRPAAIFICLCNCIAADIYRGRHRRNSIAAACGDCICFDTWPVTVFRDCECDSVSQCGSVCLSLSWLESRDCFEPMTNRVAAAGVVQVPGRSRSPAVGVAALIGTSVKNSKYSYSAETRLFG